MKTSISHVGAIGFAVAGFTFWTFSDCSMRVVGQLPSSEVIGFVGVFMALVLLAFAGFRDGIRSLWPRQPKQQFFRACLDMANLLFVFFAVKHLAFTVFYIVIFTAPIVIAIMAALVLHETITFRRFLAIVAGFIGVMIAATGFTWDRPDTRLGYAACIACVFCFSSKMIWSRVMTQTERADSLTFFTGLVMAVGGGTWMLWHIKQVHFLTSSYSLAVLFGIALFSAIGSACFFTALRYTTAATVSQYHYTQLVSGTLIGYFFWHEVVNVRMFIGGCFIVAAGLYIAADPSRGGIRAAPLNLRAD